MPSSIGLIALLVFVACNPDNGGENNPQPPAPEAADPGFKPLHRLNNTEYRNTVRDLLLTDHALSVQFSEDPVTDGFDNIADTLSVSPLLLEQYELAADEILGEVFEFENEVRSLRSVQAEGPGPTYDGGQPVGEKEYGFNAAGSISIATNIADDGAYDLKARVWAQNVGDEDAKLRILLDEVELGVFDVDGTSFVPQEIALQTDLSDGVHTFRLEFVNPSEAADRLLVVDWFAYDGPLEPEVGHSEGYTATAGLCSTLEFNEATCADQVIRAFGEKAWRRPITSEEGDWLVDVYTESASLGLDYDTSLQMAFKAALLAPDFIFRFEQDAVGEPRVLNGYELASRLSYFLWSSMPDDALFAAAADGSLLTDDGLRVQVERMMADEKADALIQGFASEWLDMRSIDAAMPVAEIYPSFDEDLRKAMREEAERIAADHMLGGYPMDDMLLGTQTWMNARLAEHYGVTDFDVYGAEWQLVDLAPLGRQGILTSPGWLTVTSHADRPSAVLRGKWINENLLCNELPPPPPDVEGSFEVDENAGSIREQEEALRLQPESTCVACHSQMDPYGHAVGAFDGIGAARTIDEIGFPIDTAVTLPDGSAVGDIVQALPIIVADPRFTACVAENLFVYSTGRTLRPEDAPYIEKAVDAFNEGGLVFEALATDIALSEPFRMKGVATE
jgi:hypothetical protein